MKITVLAENSVCKTNSLNVKSENGLSLLIEFDERKILFDTGQSDQYIQNAEKMGIDLSQVDYLVISPGHFDHGGGLKHFLKINKKVIIFLHITAAQRFHTMIFGAIPYYVGTDQNVIAQKSRVYFIEEDTLIEDKIILLEGFGEVLPQADTIKALIEKTGKRFAIDKFRHEIVMLLIENDEIVLFSGCSHSWFINTIEEVKLFSKDMRIKATFGGFHIDNSIINKNESQIYTEEMAATSGVTDPVFSTGLCTSEKNFLYIKGLTGNKIQAINTGQIFEL